MSDREYAVVGTRPVRHDGADKVTGRALYGADFPQVPDRIVDLGDGDVPLSYIRGNLLASGKVLYRGHAVAAVAAVSRHIAEEAAGLIAVEYEPLPCVLTAPEAMQEGAPLLHEDLKTRELGEPTDRVSNVADHLRFAMGDIDAGFAGQNGASDIYVRISVDKTDRRIDRGGARRGGLRTSVSPGRRIGAA